MYDAAKDSVDALRAGADIFAAMLCDCTQERAQAARGGDEDWSVVEVMCHMRDAEERALERMRVIRDESDPFIAGYDQDAWARKRNYATQDLQEALSAFLSLRAQHVDELAELAPEDWERAGKHEEHGPTTISNHTLHMISHDAGHAAQIMRQLAMQKN